MHELDAFAVAVIFTEGVWIQKVMVEECGLLVPAFFETWALLVSLLCVKALLSQPR